MNTNRQITNADVEAFHKYLQEQERSSATIDKYIRDITACRRFLNGGSLCKETVLAYKQHLIQRYAPASVNSMLAAVNCFLQYAGLTDCAVKALKLQRVSFRSNDRELSKADYLRLLSAAKNQGKLRLHLLMQSICATGIRISELPFITLEAVQVGRATVTLKGKTRTVLLPGELCRKLKKYTRERKISSGSIFISRSGRPLDRSNILHEMKALCAAAGVPKSKVFPHNLRHLFACAYMKVHRDIAMLADILGHSNINTTRIYTSYGVDFHLRNIERLGLVV